MGVERIETVDGQGLVYRTPLFVRDSKIHGGLHVFFHACLVVEFSQSLCGE
jgi:hypothetical protein